jgi:hypothetical protein
MRLKPPLVGAVLGIALASGTGCLIDSHSNTTRSGHYVSDSTLSEMRLGQTTTQWATAVIGTPTSVSKLDDEVEVWKWAYNQTETRSGYVFLLYTGSDTTTSDSAVYAEFRKGVLQRWWKG